MPEPNPDFVATAFGTIAEAIRERDYRVADLAPGQRLHHYRIEHLLATGGMSNVYVAEHVYLKQKVALKTMRGVRNHSEETAERFLREAQVLAILNASNVLKVFDAALSDRIPYVVTELLEGKDLRQHLAESGPLTINQAMDLMEQVGEVLVLQEQLGVLHRDIKPGNIWIRKNGRFCLIDYGLVGFTNSGPTTSLGGDVATMTGQILGTPLYMAPEQFLGTQEVDHRSDLFNLGATVFEGLTGARPRRGKSFTEMSESADEPMPCVSTLRSDVPDGLKIILRSLTAPAKEDRYSAASVFITDLENYRYGGRRPFGATQGTAFVAIPFHKAFEPLFDFLRTTCGEAKLAARRVDRTTEMTNIWDQIDKEIQLATAVIAVFTRSRWHRAPNPNVITEAAHARALGKPLIVLTTDPAEQLPFDWRHLPIIRYETSPRGLAALRDELLPRLRQLVRTSGH